jgi:hypothetical protein
MAGASDDDVERLAVKSFFDANQDFRIEGGRYVRHDDENLASALRSQHAGAMIGDIAAPLRKVDDPITCLRRDSG